MASLPTLSRDAVERRVLAFFRTAFDGLPLGVKRFLGRSARALSNNIWGLHNAIENIDADIVPSAKSSDDVLSDWAFTLGLPDGAGGYGRRVALASSGGVATLTGVLGTAYLDGSIAVAEDGTTEVALSGAVTIAGTPPGFGSVAGAKFVGVTTGVVSNLPVGSKLTWQNPPPGADVSFTLTSALTDGADVEDNPTLFARIITRLQTPPRGGVAEDFREWAESASGIVYAYIYGRRQGTGTVDVVVVTGGTGQGRIPSETQRAAADAAIQAARPIGAEQVNTLVPSMPNANGHVARVRVAPFASKYNFDWDDTADTYTVDLYTPGPPATLRLNVLAPATLKAQIDAYAAGTAPAPRLQVLSTGSVINGSIGCVAWVDGGGKTTLTLETVTSKFTTPTVGDTVYAYGPAVATIAAGVLALADSLGPSRVSGYADSITPWHDRLTVSGLIGVAEAAIDTDGTSLIEEVLVNGATIDGVELDVRGADATVTTAPELLYWKHIAVTA